MWKKKNNRTLSYKKRREQYKALLTKQHGEKWKELCMVKTARPGGVWKPCINEPLDGFHYCNSHRWWPETTLRGQIPCVNEICGGYTYRLSCLCCNSSFGLAQRLVVTLLFLVE